MMVSAVAATPHDDDDEDDAVALPFLAALAPPLMALSFDEL